MFNVSSLVVRMACCIYILCLDKNHKISLLLYITRKVWCILILIATKSESQKDVVGHAPDAGFGSSIQSHSSSKYGVSSSTRWRNSPCC